MEVRVEDETLVVEVTDRGPGFGGELGPGLRYCRAVVEAHGGALTHRSRAEGGAFFGVSFPGVVEARRLGAATPAPEVEPPPRVWFADDEALVRKAVTRLLRHAGYELTSFADGETLLAALEKVDPRPATEGAHF